jgi:adenine/guanine phosphoribosyltransferase-like PRPP-binding protein
MVDPGPSPSGPEASAPGTGAEDAWTRSTTDFWQRLEPTADWHGRWGPPYRHGFPMPVGGGQMLVLPVRRLPSSPDRAVASLIANQAALDVIDHLAQAMGELARTLRPEVVVGLPTLGMMFAPGVARTLGHPRWVPLGYSRKFWYQDALATTVASITTPGAGKAIYLDPNQLPLVVGRRVVIVDDVVSSAQTLHRVWDLLERLGADVTGAVVAMRQGVAWRGNLTPARVARVLGVGDSPHLVLQRDGWWPAADDWTQAR